MHLPEDKRTVISIKNKKKAGERISAITSYDFPTTQIVSEAGIDIVLVGDTLGMVVQGHKNTLTVTMDEMVYHTRMVARAEPVSLVVADMPFESYHVTTEQAVANAIRFVKEGGAEAVKLEGGRNRFAVTEAILATEIPVMGHLGLTPQSVHKFGGFKIQGKLKQRAREILDDALTLQDLGVFAIVLEAIPTELAKKITETLTIPTIGIGAGKHCDGQILVFHDLIGYSEGYQPKFVRQYANLKTTIHQALTDYIKDIDSGTFPGEQESYHLKKDIDEFLK